MNTKKTKKKRWKDNLKKKNTWTNNFSVTSAWFNLRQCLSGRSGTLFSSCSLTAVQTYRLPPPPPPPFSLQSLQMRLSALKTICLHCPRGPFPFVCDLSVTVQVSFLPARKTSIAHYSSNPMAHPNRLFHSFFFFFFAAEQQDLFPMTMTMSLSTT